MRQLIVICALALSACATAPPAAAQAIGDAGDIAMTNTCLAEHAPPDDARLCIGAVTRRCGEAMGEDAASTTGGMAICAGRERAAWSALLDEFARALRARESPTQVILLEQALRKGAEWSVVRCAYAASLYEGGSLARVLAAQCARDTAAERALDLYERIHAFDEP